MLTYSEFREIGRASSTSRVPRARSPATAVADEPMAKMPSMASASGCCSPSVIEPANVNSEPEPMFSICSGNAPEFARSRIASLKASKMIGMITPHAMAASVTTTRLHAVPAQGLDQETAVHPPSLCGSSGSASSA